jgi:hypothetical protein
MALPPSLAGAVHETTAEALPATADTPVGAPGAVSGASGVTAADGDEADPVPVELVAVTVNVYGVPLVRPVTVQGLDGPEQVRPPGDEVAV